MITNSKNNLIVSGLPGDLICRPLSDSQTHDVTLQ